MLLHTLIHTYTSSGSMPADAEAHRPSLDALMGDYWEKMQVYQGIKLESIEFKRWALPCVGPE